MTSRRALTEHEYLILASMLTEPLHGYGIIQQVRALSDGVISLSPGTLYKALDRMLDDGWIQISSEEIVSGRLRRNYRLTATGKAVFAAEAQRRSTMEKAVRRIARRPALGESL
ncbi:PadR family transcriptional regulator [Rhizocola hellebori]|uniref:PadR family transcriptional regulator n=1 Tax=Rhizocola hellebori TaxID=1392758 RepID=UPI001EF347D6|nr:PadR family transcriptional regulator [Rhizocola hellebori]